MGIPKETHLNCKFCGRPHFSYAKTMRRGEFQTTVYLMCNVLHFYIFMLSTLCLFVSNVQHWLLSGTDEDQIDIVFLLITNSGFHIKQESCQHTSFPFWLDFKERVPLNVLCRSDMIYSLDLRVNSTIQMEPQWLFLCAGPVIRMNHRSPSVLMKEWLAAGPQSVILAHVRPPLRSTNCSWR